MAGKVESRRKNNTKGESQHWNSSAYVCSGCEKTFETKELLGIHHTICVERKKLEYQLSKLTRLMKEKIRKKQRCRYRGAYR
ncbi:MAG: hypothetical protein AB1633_06045 [Elusimicrobiota bacterium]